jgi:hypothetical protein
VKEAASMPQFSFKTDELEKNWEKLYIFSLSFKQPIKQCIRMGSIPASHSELPGLKSHHGDWLL